MSSTLPTMPTMPVLFIGHGSPLNVLEDNVWRRNWQDLGQDLLRRYPRPQAILCISAHWLTQGGWWLTGMAQPRTIHDFGGFPRELFEQQYPAPGAPQLAQHWAQLLRDPTSGQALAVDADQWGLDHGAWGVLKPMFPLADIPVVQLSMDYTRAPAEHFALGQQLHKLRQQGVLIVASGNIVHNLRAMRLGAGINATYPWAHEFDAKVTTLVAARQLHELTQFLQWGEAAQQSHPSHEHFLPLLYAAGAVDADDSAYFFNTGFQAAGISMRSILWAPGG